MSESVVFQHAYSEPFRGSDLKCQDPSLAQQNFKDEVDINFLLERFKVTGEMPRGLVLPTYGDFTGVSDYRSAMDAVNKARGAFMDLPAQLRARFGNDPQEFLEFVSNDANRAEAERLGLVLAKQDVRGIGGAAPDAKPAGDSKSSQEA